MGRRWQKKTSLVRGLGWSISLSDEGDGLHAAENSLDEGDGLQPVRLNVKMNRLQPLRVLLSTEKQCPQGLQTGCGKTRALYQGTTLVVP